MFSPRLNSSAVINKVTVKGWNPETKELISGDASVQSSKLGSQTSVSGSGDLGNEESFTVDHPIWSQEEAVALAKAKIQDAALTYITGEAEVSGNGVFDLGKVVKITANAVGGDDPFNGNYYIMGVTHRHPRVQGQGRRRVRHHPSPRARRAEEIDALRWPTEGVDGCRPVWTALRHRLPEQGSG